MTALPKHAAPTPFREDSLGAHLPGAAGHLPRHCDCVPCAHLMPALHIRRPARHGVAAAR